MGSVYVTIANATPEQIKYYLGMPVAFAINECLKYQRLYSEAVGFILEKDLVDEFNQWNETNQAKK